MSLMRTGSFDPFRGFVRHYQAARRLSSSCFANSRSPRALSEKIKSARKSSDYRGAMNDVFDSMERDLLMSPWGLATRFPAAHMLAGTIPVGSGAAGGGATGDGKFGMHLDFHENDRGFELIADLPGVKKEDITVDVDNASGVLTVSGERKSVREEKDEGGEEGERKYHFVERSYGKTTRSIRLPETADTSKANADYTGGVLTLTFLKREVAATRRIRIPVEDGDGKDTITEGGGAAPTTEGDKV